MNNPENKRNSYNHEDLELCSKGDLFGADSGRLPAGNMLMVDRIVEINADGGLHGKGYIEAELDIKPDLWFFACHFVGDPVMPGCLGLDAGNSQNPERRGGNKLAESGLDHGMFHFLLFV